MAVMSGFITCVPPMRMAKGGSLSTRRVSDAGGRRGKLSSGSAQLWDRMGVGLQGCAGVGDAEGCSARLLPRDVLGHATSVEHRRDVAQVPILGVLLLRAQRERSRMA